ncbi:MAG: hypothetical protein LBO68_02165 [Synergistaceae bacterium]|jgi:hypothetical protein|nr:hypothetical protein [Synergistaceae bacterium]
MAIDGVPDWLEAHVSRGLSAVWEEIPAEDPGLRLETLALVASRLFPGYDVTVDTKRNAGFLRLPRVSLKAQNPLEWSATVVLPELRDPVLAWFERDTPGMAGEVASLLKGLPVEALAWADSALGDQVKEIVGRRLPGWDFSLLARLDNDPARSVGVLQISFRPRPPLVLAVTPSIFSSTLPAMFRSDLTAKLIPGLSSIIGLPVEWVAFHREDAELLARNLLEDRNAVSNTRSRVAVSFVPDQVSRVDATVNSERFVLQVWLAAYAGVQERYPELGILAGWNTRRWTGLDLELYDEAIVDIGEFGLTNRLGLRFTLGGQFRLGVEVEWPEQDVWYRAGWDPGGIRRPYAQWRYSDKHGHNAALGYRIDEHISIEIHYDGRYDEKVGIRGILLL